MNSWKLLWPILGVLLIGAAIVVWSSQGYGKVSPDAYQVATALYGSCLAESDQRLQSVSLLVSDESEQPLELSDSERRWFESMIRTAEGGDWKSAAKSAKRMMEDQVEY